MALDSWYQQGRSVVGSASAAVRRFSAVQGSSVTGIVPAAPQPTISRTAPYIQAIYPRPFPIPTLSGHGTPPGRRGGRVVFPPYNRANPSNIRGR